MLMFVGDWILATLPRETEMTGLNQFRSPLSCRAAPLFCSMTDLALRIRVRSCTIQYTQPTDSTWLNPWEAKLVKELPIFYGTLKVHCRVHRSSPPYDQNQETYLFLTFNYMYLRNVKHQKKIIFIHEPARWIISHCLWF